MSWYDLYSKTKELNLDYDMDIMPYIFGEKDLVLDSNDVEISIDDIQSILNEDQEPEEDEGLEI